MYFFRELSDLVLLALIELPLVRSVSNHIISKLSASQMMEHKSLFTGVYHRAVVQFFEFARKIGFFRKIGKHAEDLFIHLL